AVRLETTQVLRRHVQGLKESNLLISRLGAAGQWEKAIHVLSEISAKRLLPTVVSYNATLAACGRAQRWASSLQLLQSLASGGFSGVQPDLISFNTAITCCGRGRQRGRALQLLPALRGARLT
ncbi:unnamed protein product, partial [Polarella glacialis]